MITEQLARFYATYPDPEVRRPERALELAQHATELGPRESGALNTLGIAHYRCAQWQSAIGELQKSIDLRKGGEVWDWFYMAMALWQLGELEEALKWYEQAADWAKTPFRFHQVRFLYREAAELLGQPLPDFQMK